MHPLYNLLNQYKSIVSSASVTNVLQSSIYFRFDNIDWMRLWCKQWSTTPHARMLQLSSSYRTVFMSRDKRRMARIQRWFLLRYCLLRRIVGSINAKIFHGMMNLCNYQSQLILHDSLMLYNYNILYSV